MKLVYEMTLSLRFVQEVEELKNIKSDREYAENVAQMICDEAVFTDTVVTYDVLNSALNVS